MGERSNHTQSFFTCDRLSACLKYFDKVNQVHIKYYVHLQHDTPKTDVAELRGLANSLQAGSCIEGSTCAKLPSSNFHQNITFREHHLRKEKQLPLELEIPSGHECMCFAKHSSEGMFWRQFVCANLD